MTTVAERVRAGATYADTHLVGWAKFIDLKLFNMAHCSSCVIGQTLGDYHRGCEALCLTRLQAIDLGFHAASHMDFIEFSRLSYADQVAHCEAEKAEYAALKAAWLVEIADRVNTPESTAAAIEAEEALVLTSAPDLSREGSPL